MVSLGSFAMLLNARLVRSLKQKFFHFVKPPSGTPLFFKMFHLAPSSTSLQLVKLCFTSPSDTFIRNDIVPLLMNALHLFSDKLSCRQVLNLLVFFGFMVNYMLRVNLTIAIVEMVIPTPHQTNTSLDLLGNLTTDLPDFVDPTDAPLDLSSPPGLDDDALSKSADVKETPIAAVSWAKS